MPGATKIPVVVAMSGGVDSSVAALLLKQAGYEVIGLTMQVWDHAQEGARVARCQGGRGTPTGPGRSYQGCCSLEDIYDARRVAEQLGIPFYVVNFQERFAEKVVAPFVADYLAGRTPNPCVLCNREIKFQALLSRARELGAAYLATGHYARVALDDQDGEARMLCGLDSNKDQSYFLFDMTQDQLRATLFPVGALQKKEVRARAGQAGLRVKDKPESQEICFVDQGHYSEFVRNRLGSERLNGAGEIQDLDGKVLGRHEGIFHYTIGQRKGLKISAPKPLYVIALDAEKNLVQVGPEAALFHRRLRVRDLNWIAGTPAMPAEDVQVKIRYKAPAQPATMEPGENGRWRICFHEPQRAITPGQAAVLYRGEEVLGGGWIEGSEA